MSKESSKLLESARNKFAPRDLSLAEEKLFRAAESGETASARSGDKMQDDPANAGNWHANRVVRAECIAWLCTDREASALVTHRGIRIIGMRVDSELDLSDAQIKFPFRILNCAFTGRILLQDTQLPFLSLQGCHIKDFHGDRLKVPGSVCLGNGFKAEGEVRLVRATIGSDLNCIGAQFLNSDGPALSADGVQINGSAFLRNGFKAEGEVRLVQATIGGNLECDGAQFSNSKGLALFAEGVEIKGGAYLRKGFKAEGEVRLVGATIGGSLDCTDAHFLNSNGPALSAEGVEIKGGAFLGYGFKAEGEVRLVRATIGTDLECDEAHFLNSNGPALSAEGVEIKGGAYLRKGFKAEGEVRLVGATIGGNLECTDGAQFSNSKGLALIADGVEIKSEAFLGYGFKAEGEVRLVRATIGGSLDCTDAQFSNSIGPAITADGVEIKSEAYLGYGFKAEGEVRLLGATIGGSLDCTGAHFSNSNGSALSADGIQIKRDASLGNGFRAEGEVRLLGATIGRSFDCDGGQFSNSSGPALDAEGVQINGAASLSDGFKAEGQVTLANATMGVLRIRGVLGPENIVLDLRYAKVGTFWDDEHSWPRAGNLSLDGFRYERFYAESPLDAKSRGKWLHRQPSDKFLPQPYEQLAATLRKMGHERHARLVMIQKNRDQAPFARFLGQRWWWYNFFGRAIGYGYAPWRAFVGSVLMIVLGWFLFAFGSSHHLISPAKESAYEKDSNGQFMLVDETRKIADDYPVFNPFVYSLESFTPLLKLDQSMNWTPNANHGAQVHLWRWQLTTGSLLRGYLWSHIIIGWVLTTLWVGAVTGLVKT